MGILRPHILGMERSHPPELKRSRYDSARRVMTAGALDAGATDDRCRIALGFIMVHLFRGGQIARAWQGCGPVAGLDPLAHVSVSIASRIGSPGGARRQV